MFDTAPPTDRSDRFVSYFLGPRIGISLTRRTIIRTTESWSTRDTWIERRMDETSYDEDLSENSFYQVLRQEYASLFERAINEGLIICVPRCGTFTKSALVEEDFLNHILMPEADDNPSPRFRTLAGKEVKLSNRVLTVEYDVAKPCSAHLLFEETFYTDASSKYSLWCIEHPLERSISASGEDVLAVTNLREALDFLWTEVLNKDIIKDMTMGIEEFQESHENLENETIEVQRDVVGRLNAMNLRMLLQDVRLRAKTESNRHYFERIKIAAETYTLHGLRNILPRSVAARTCQEDASLNKTIKNLHDVQLRDLGISLDTYEGILRGKLELSRLTVYSTVLGKVGCLKKAIRYATEEGTGSHRHRRNHRRILSSDHILPVLVFLVIRAGVPNWIGQLTFMRQFRFSADSKNNEADEAAFFITCLEAAIEHIRSGVLKTVTEPTTPVATMAPASIINGKNNENDEIENEDTSSSLTNLFEAVRQSDLSRVDAILVPCSDDSRSSNKTCTITERLKLCHPLCACEKCETRIAGASSLTKHLATVDSRDERGMSVIHVASLCGHVNIVDYLLEHGADPNDSDADGATPLHCAASRGHQNTLLLLLHANADPTTSDSRGNTPLHLASDHGHEGCVKALLYFTEQIAIPFDKSPVNSNGETPLHHAAKWGYDDIVEILMEHGANPRVTDRRGQTPLAIAHTSRISKLLQLDSSNLPPSDRSTPIFLYPAVGAKPTTASKQHHPPPAHPNNAHKINTLFAAIVENDLRLACYYLGLELPLSSSSSSSGKSPNGSHVLRTRSLCHPLCNCDICQVDGSPTCDEALPGDRHDKTSTLPLNISNERNETPLHVACNHGRTDMVEILLDAGASVHLKTIDGRTPLHNASSRGFFNIVKLLLNCGNCDVNAIDLLGDTSLHLAARNANPRTVQLLLRYGAFTNIRNSRGIVPLEEVEKIITTNNDHVLMIQSFYAIAKILKSNRAIDYL